MCFLSMFFTPKDWDMFVEGVVFPCNSTVYDTTKIILRFFFFVFFFFVFFFVRNLIQLPENKFLIYILNQLFNITLIDFVNVGESLCHTMVYSICLHAFKVSNWCIIYPVLWTIWESILTDFLKDWKTKGPKQSLLWFLFVFCHPFHAARFHGTQ